MLWKGYHRRVDSKPLPDPEFVGLRDLIARARTPEIEVVFTQCYGALFAREFAEAIGRSPCARKVCDC